MVRVFMNYIDENHLYASLNTAALAPAGILFFHLNIRYVSSGSAMLVGSTWVSCWFLGPGRYVIASHIGYYYCTSCAYPYE